MTPIGFSQYNYLNNNNYQFPASQAGSSYGLASSNGLTSSSNGLTGDMFQLQGQQNGQVNQPQNPMEMMMQMMQMMMGFMMKMIQMFMGMMGGMMPGMAGQQGQQLGNTGQFPSATYPQGTSNNGTYPSSGSSSYPGSNGSYAYAGPQGSYAGSYGGNGTGGCSASAGSNGNGSYASSSSGSGAANSLSTAPASGVTNNPGAGVYGGVKLNQEQINNARIIAEVGTEMGASKRDISTAIATAMQESQLKNINHGDRDSVGLFQQRPSCGWGSRQQCTDPRYSSRKFYEKLLKDKGRNNRSLTQSAQRVQRSAYPNAYAKWENMAVSVTNSTVKS